MPKPARIRNLNVFKADELSRYTNLTKQLRSVVIETRELANGFAFRISGERLSPHLARYRQIPKDEILAPVYSPAELEDAETRLRDFLIYRFGGRIATLQKEVIRVCAPGTFGFPSLKLPAAARCC